MSDPIFGDLLDPGNRFALHRENLDGVKHLYRRAPLDPVPGQPLLLILTTSSSALYDSARCLYTIDGTDPSSVSAARLDLQLDSTDWDVATWSYIRTWKTFLPPQPAKTLVRYRLEAHRADTGQWVAADTGPENHPGNSFALWIDHDPIPEWAHEAVVYQIFPDRFNPGSARDWNKVNSLADIHGGTLRGITEKLDYIRSMGFNTIWINPFFKTTSHHGYNASDYYTVEPRLGTNADLKQLIEQAHARGIRMILDFVANHWSKDHFTFQDAIKNPHSPYHDWYFWNKWPENYECYFKVKELPKLNLNPGPASDYLLMVARHWLREGFDGYRLDFAYGPPHDFWVDFRRACREVKPDCWIFGEIIHTVPMLLSYTGIMDGTLDFHLARALRETFATGKMTLAEFEAFLSGHEAFFPPGHIRPSFLDNHDEERFLFHAGNDKDRLQLAALVLYTLSGPPIVYCGTETGLSQERPLAGNGFEQCRLPMNWNSADIALQEYFQRLGKLRREHSVLWTGSRRVVHLDAQQKTYAYLREGKDGKVLVAVNLSDFPQQVSIHGTGFHSASDPLNWNRITVRDKTLEVHLLPKSGSFII
jgi:cyclomaltodextrinase